MLVLLALADWCGDDGRSLHPSISAVAKKCRLSEVQARRIIHVLIDGGYLEVVGNHTGGKPGSTRQYRLNVAQLDRVDNENTTLTDETPTAIPNERGQIDERALTGDREGSHTRSETALTGESQTIIEPSISTKKIKRTRKVLNNALASASAARVPPSSTPTPKSQTLACPYDKIVSAYHELMPDNPRCKVLSPERKVKLKARWEQAAKLTCKPFGYTTVEDGLTAWRQFFDICNDSDFLTGRVEPTQGRKRFFADLFWLTTAEKFAACLENRYHDLGRSAGTLRADDRAVKEANDRAAEFLVGVPSSAHEGAGELWGVKCPRH